MRSSPAPSMRAASSTLSGMERAYWRTRKMPKTLARPGTITPAYVFTRWSSRSIRKSGSMATWAGITSAASSRRKMRSRPAKRSFAKA